MKYLPGILFLLLSLMSPYVALAADSANGDASSEQSDADGKKTEGDEAEEEEPECE